MTKPRKGDEIVLSALRNDARIKHTTLARQNSWPVSTTQERVQRCIKKYVTRHVALLNINALGLRRTLWIARPSVSGREQWLALNAKIPFINNLAKLHDGSFMLETLTRNAAEELAVRRALTSASCSKIECIPVLDDVCLERAFTDTLSAAPEALRTVFGATGDNPEKPL